MESGTYPIRVAVVIGKYVTAGTKSYVMNYYNGMDKTVIQYDFFINSNSPDKDYSEIELQGGRVFEIPTLKNPIKNIYAYYKVFKKEKYKIVHGCINTLNVFPMFAAWIAKVPVRIAENLSTAHPGEKKTFIKNILRPFNKIFPTHFAANSKYAAEWMYGKKNLDKCKIFHNALNLDVYRYDENIRNNVRKKLGYENCFVIGHIGRFDYQKNHDFLIDIFNEVYKNDKSARLVLIGHGDLKDDIYKKIERLGLSSVVYDGGATSDIMPYYNAMDCFVLPSFYEGLPVVGIEAQATGLPCVISRDVTSETQITDNVKFVSLEKSAELWADEILKYKNHLRKDERDAVALAGYNVKEENKKLEKYYKHCLCNSKK